MQPLAEVAQNQTGAVISKIEQIFESISACILEERKNMVIPLKTRAKMKNGALSCDEAKGRRKSETRSINYPSRNPKEAWKFGQSTFKMWILAYVAAAALLRILELSHEALVTGVSTTKRDIYYRDPGLFVKQSVVDRYVDDIAYTFGVERDALNVIAAAKGLVAGSFKITKNGGLSTDYSTENESLLVPNSKDIRSVEMFEVCWILVIEKEATFQTLNSNRCWQDFLAGRGILITGKGYPDIQTRQFLNLLSATHPGIPIYALMDFDPDGIGIMSTYKYGSANHFHAPNLSVPSIKWLGIRSSDFLCSDVDPRGLITLSARDRRIAVRMLERDGFQVDGINRLWREELQTMLNLNMKAEIQILGNADRLSAWLESKLVHARQELQQSLLPDTF